MRIGTGFDAHRLVEGRPLVLGGAEIPHERGLAGHSDADVVCHALIDAIFGAAGAGDIGTHFPDSDERYRDISSLKLLALAADELERAGFAIANADITVIAEEPKLAPFVPLMKEKMAGALGIDPRRLGLKATTTEGLGWTGRGEGIAAQAVVMIEGEALD